MKNVSTILRNSIALATLFAATGASAEGFYLSGSLGQSFTDDVSSNGTFASFARHAAHKTRSSCSVTHSRQKKRVHSGQRATASRWE